jgi:peptide deformylase
LAGFPVRHAPPRTISPFDLPAERDAAQVVDQLFAAVDGIGRVHSFANS